MHEGLKILDDAEDVEGLRARLRATAQRSNRRKSALKQLQKAFDLQVASNVYLCNRWEVELRRADRLQQQVFDLKAELATARTALGGRPTSAWRRLWSRK